MHDLISHTVTYDPSLPNDKLDFEGPKWGMRRNFLSMDEGSSIE